MGFKNRGMRRRAVPDRWRMCSSDGCPEQVGPYAGNQCEECHRYFCWPHLVESTVDGVRLKLCHGCCAARGEGLVAGD